MSPSFLPYISHPSSYVVHAFSVHLPSRLLWLSVEKFRRFLPLAPALNDYFVDLAREVFFFLLQNFPLFSTMLCCPLPFLPEFSTIRLVVV
jgi:hypothetical protein